MDVVSELPSLTHAQLSEPSIQLTALPVPYTTDYTFMHNSQHAHNISMPHYSPSFLSSSQFESCCGSDRTSFRPSPLSLLSGISTATHYIHTYYILISGRLTLQPGKIVAMKAGLSRKCPIKFLRLQRTWIGGGRQYLLWLDEQSRSTTGKNYG